MITDLNNKVIDVHTHIINPGLYPFEIMYEGNRIPKNLMEALLEVVDHTDGVIDWGEKIFNKLKGTDYNIDRFLDVFRLTFEDNAKKLLSEMDEAGVDVACVMMLDLGIAYGHDYLEIPFEKQIELFSSLPKLSGGRLLPFFAVDPRREGIYEIMVDALQNKGFLGIKLYPPLGYNMWQKGVDTPVNDRMYKILKYCMDNSIPVTVHCSPGGIESEDGGSDFSKPYNFRDTTIKFSNLRMNMAHFGGNSNFIDYMIYGKSQPWTGEIVRYMTENYYPYPRVVSDIAFHNGAIDNFKRWKKSIKITVDNPFTSACVNFGSDWPLFLFQYSYSDFIKAVKKALKEDFEIIASINPTMYLLGDEETILPERILRFYEEV